MSEHKTPPRIESKSEVPPGAPAKPRRSRSRSPAHSLSESSPLPDSPPWVPYSPSSYRGSRVSSRSAVINSRLSPTPVRERSPNAIPSPIHQPDNRQVPIVDKDGIEFCYYQSRYDDDYHTWRTYEDSSYPRGSSRLSNHELRWISRSDETRQHLVLSVSLQ
jgi:hypothetical protein